MTAVEWLQEQYTKQITFLHREDFEQAKEMEKQQIIDAFEKAMETDIYNEPLKVGKTYFNETFKNK